jgi:C-terminal processing protease CtpA/Prc
MLRDLFSAGLMTRLSPRTPRRWLHLILAALVSAGAQHAAAQNSNTLTALDSAFYRVQSFDTGAGDQPIAINHLGIETEHAADGGHLITAALEGYPAHAAGLERGDVILRIDGAEFHPILSLNPRAAEGEFHPLRGSVEVTYKRGATILTAPVAPVFESLYDSYRSATLNSVLSFAAGNKVIGYVRLWALTRETGDLIALAELIKSLHDTDGIVLDLRNSHGYLASGHIDFFRTSRSDFLSISQSDQIEKAETNREQSRLLPDRPRDDTLRAYRKPVAILIDRSTRGAAELLAYQLAKLDRVTTVGEATLGRLGSYVSDSSGEKVLEYSAAYSTLIDGEPFEGVGIKPKRSVSFPYESISRNDPQFQVAVNVLMGVI